MESRLIVDLSTGHLEVSGSEDLVKHIFNEFREEISSRAVRKADPPETVDNEKKPAREAAPKKASSKKTSASSDVNKDLDTLGLEDFFAPFEAKGDAERAMIFIKFLQEQKKMTTCTLSDVYTCFFALKSKLKLPSITSLIKNDASRTKFFSVSEGNMSLTRLGETHFSQKLKKNPPIS